MDNIGKVDHKKDNKDFHQKLSDLFNYTILHGLPLAIWSKPGEAGLRAICQLNTRKHSLEEIENAPSGFLFSPFSPSESCEVNFLSADVSLESDSNELVFDPTLAPSEHYDGLEQYMSNQKAGNGDAFLQQLNDHAIHSAGQKEYEALVEKCVEAIRSGVYQKIVPSRTHRIELPEKFHPLSEFRKLAEAYPNAFVSLVHIPGNGIWLGATPELLLSVESNRVFKTVALAGTQVVQPDFPLLKVAWTQKEIEEQALVSRYIINCFKKIRLREFEEYGPKTVRAGNLAHLKTMFEVDMKEVNFPQLGTVMLELLHPTSAVCGMPMKSAHEFLQTHECYDREFYSGYLGPVNIGDSTDLFVNLRCMKIGRHTATLFAGAGVTEDSNPHDEWKETEMKFRTLLNIIS